MSWPEGACATVSLISPSGMCKSTWWPDSRSRNCSPVPGLPRLRDQERQGRLARATKLRDQGALDKCVLPGAGTPRSRQAPWPANPGCLHTSQPFLFGLSVRVGGQASGCRRTHSTRQHVRRRPDRSAWRRAEQSPEGRSRCTYWRCGDRARSSVLDGCGQVSAGPAQAAVPGSGTGLDSAGACAR
jgi:hypothetical protein